MASKDPVATIEDLSNCDVGHWTDESQDDYFTITPQSPIDYTRPRRRSKFTELDVDGENTCVKENNLTPSNRTDLFTRRRSTSLLTESSCDSDDESFRTALPRFSSYPRLYILTLVLLIAVPLLYDTKWLALPNASIIGARAGVIRRADRNNEAITGHDLLRRQNTNTDVCSRWAAQSALVNGTMYLYGGHATQEPGEHDGTWTNDFFTVDLTKSWDISAPVVSGLPQPSGPPAVANGFLWNSYDSLYLYGGIVSDSPAAVPEPYSLWEYQIKNAKWVEHENPKTSNGNSSNGGNQPVLQTGEGAGISVPELGRGYFFAGHLDHYTTPGWSVQVARLYLKSLLEFTFPGYSNDGVDNLSGGKTAGSDGAWRNVTEGGIQDTAKFPSRADGALVFVPGFGADGILLSIAGGLVTGPGQNESSFSQMNVIDVYDIATSTWYKQATTGKYPSLRVNPCAVAASAPDGSSTNVYVYGGQNLLPYGQQIQYDEMWILTVPSFTWVQVDTDGQSVPPARVGASCSIWNGQIVVVGGYTGPDLSCDSGFYVFSATDLKWQNNYNVLSDGGADTKNTQNQQISQQDDPHGLSGSYGYQVPGAVQSVIGGNANGGATITAPAQAATQGPLATGKPITYTVTNSNGAVVTQTGTSSVTAGGSQNGKGGPNIGAIVAGVVAGFFAVLAAYLGFCAWVYRRQLALYKNHVAMSQRALAGGPNEKTSFIPSSTEGSSARNGKTSSSLAGGSSGIGGASTKLTQSNSNGQDGDVPPLPTGVWPPVGRNSTANSSIEDLMMGQEPSFVGVLLNPRRSLRVINRD
ncbi:MAG: hypothetical protein LQ350_001008 [Teloschistes chrysophthalmus]|nr:MAG: hypothetical protein LQ350_001008 [Niorma chrysophthalma]